MPEIIGRQVAAAAGETDTEGCLGDDHGRTLRVPWRVKGGKVKGNDPSERAGNY
jgi:hypothetical protein